MVQPLWKTLWRVVTKIKTYSHRIQQFHFFFFFFSAIPFLSTYPKELKERTERYSYPHVHRDIIHMNPIGRNSSSTDAWINEMWYSYVMARYSALKKEGRGATCYTMDEL